MLMYDWRIAAAVIGLGIVWLLVRALRRKRQ